MFLEKDHGSHLPPQEVSRPYPAHEGISAQDSNKQTLECVLSPPLLITLAMVWVVNWEIVSQSQGTQWEESHYVTVSSTTLFFFRPGLNLLLLYYCKGGGEHMPYLALHVILSLWPISILNLSNVCLMSVC